MAIPAANTTAKLRIVSAQTCYPTKDDDKKKNESMHPNNKYVCEWRESYHTLAIDMPYGHHLTNPKKREYITTTTTTTRTYRPGTAHVQIQ